MRSWFASASMRPARSFASASRASSSSSVSTKDRKSGTKSLRMSLVTAFLLHCGHRPPLPRFFRSSQVWMQLWPKQWPHASAHTWWGPEMATGSRHTLHASVPCDSPCVIIGTASAASRGGGPSSSSSSFPSDVPSPSSPSGAAASSIGGSAASTRSGGVSAIPSSVSTATAVSSTSSAMCTPLCQSSSERPI